MGPVPRADTKAGAAVFLSGGGAGVAAMPGLAVSSPLPSHAPHHQLPSMRDVRPLGSVALGGAAVLGVGLPPSTSHGDRDKAAHGASPPASDASVAAAGST